MLSIAIPSKNERFLDNTIRDVLENATGEIEIFPVLDGYDCKKIKDPRVHYIQLPETRDPKKRQGINTMVQCCKGDYVMSLDAHCMVAKGFDEQLIKDHQPNWVQIPRRHRLDAENWCIQKQCDDRPPIDYEYIMYPEKFTPRSIHGFKWDERTRDREDIKIDDTLTFQGSCWFMTKKWFKKRRFMEIDGYQGWGQEAEEISFKTRRAGGRVMTNKNTWYAHLHKGKKHGRMYFLPADITRKSYEYTYKKWIKTDTFRNLIKQFMPIPGWPEDWEKQLCNQ